MYLKMNERYQIKPSPKCGFTDPKVKNNGY